MLSRDTRCHSSGPHLISQNLEPNKFSGNAKGWTDRQMHTERHTKTHIPVSIPACTSRLQHIHSLTPRSPPPGGHQVPRCPLTSLTQLQPKGQLCALRALPALTPACCPRLPPTPPGPYSPATLSCPPSQDTPATSHLCARAAGPCPGMSVLSLPYSAKSCSSFKARQKSWGLLPQHPGAQGPFLHLCMAFSLTRQEALEDRIPISGTRTPSTWHCSGQSLCQVSVASSAPSTQRCCPICAKPQLCLALLDFNNGRHSLQLHLPGTPMTTCHEAPMPADHSQAPAAALTLCRGISLLPSSSGKSFFLYCLSKLIPTTLGRKRKGLCH